jgi:hypothetical protein
MKKGMRIVVITLGCVYCGLIAQSLEANSNVKSQSTDLYARRGSDDYGYDDSHRGRGRDDHYEDRHYHDHHKDYKHYRRFPSSYYHYKKLYYYPSKRYYYYYDILPEKTHYYSWEKDIVASNPQYLCVTSIANMASQGIPDVVIITEIERTKSTYTLNDDTIVYLRQNDVSDRVIEAMQQ